MSIFTIIITVLCFGVIIMVHELGHFFVAKKCGIRVLEFSLGMGPALYKKQSGETTYSLRWLPIGGYCAMEGEDDSSTDPRAFRKRPVWQRALVTVAGAVMNIILGFLLLIGANCLDTALTSTTIASFHTDEAGNDCSTSSQWLEPGDRLLSINGLHIFSATDISYALQNDDASTFTLVVKRNGETVTLPEVSFLDTNTQGLLDFYVYGIEKTTGSVLAYSVKDTISSARLIWISFIDLISGKYGFHDLSGVVGIVDSTVEIVQQSPTFREKALSLLGLMSFITINVGIFNLIPFPALDGGRLVFLVIEAIRRKPIKAEIEGKIHFVALALLMLLMLAITGQDIFRLFQ